jgi:hypothetical protein
LSAGKFQKLKVFDGGTIIVLGFVRRRDAARTTSRNNAKNTDMHEITDAAYYAQTQELLRHSNNWLFMGWATAFLLCGGALIFALPFYPEAYRLFRRLCAAKRRIKARQARNVIQA